MIRSIITLLAFTISLSATVINVPIDQTTIQGGLSAASAGDTVLVQPGTYAENIYWPETNSIKLMSAGDTSNTTIDGSGVSSVIYMNPQTAIIDTNTLIQGFNIRNGGGVANGGGMYLNASSPKILGVSITSNIATNYGGGLYLSSSTPKLSDVTIINNSAYYGGGMYLSSSNPVITNATILGNTVTYNGKGGGMYLDTSQPIIISTQIISNTASSNGKGGGMYLSNSSPSIINTTITTNISISGGGLYLSGSNPTVSESVITGNEAALGMGGGLFLSGSNPIITSVVINNNSARDHGGGLYLSGSDPAISDVSIIGNTVATYGGGIFMSGSNPTISGVTVSANSSGYGGGMYISNSSPTYTDVSISSNVAWRGGGLYLTSSNPTITDVLISSNTATGQGGGIYLSGSSPEITDVSIISNSATDFGGGLYLSTSSPTIQGAFISNNSEGIYIESGSPIISGNAILGNGMGLYNIDNTNLTSVINNYWGDFTGPYHPLNNTSGTGDSVNVFVTIAPWLVAPPDLLAGSPVTITGLSLKTDSLFQTTLSDNIEAGDSLYIELQGPDADSLSRGLAVVWVVNTMNQDTIVVTLEESALTSGKFRAKVYTGIATDNATNTILGEDGQALKVISRLNPNFQSTVIIGDTPLPILTDLSIVGESDQHHILGHTPVFNWSYTDPLGTAQASYQVEVSSDSTYASIDIWDSGIVSSSDTSVVFAGSQLTNGFTYYARLQVVTANGIPSNHIELSYRMNSVPSALVAVRPIDSIIISNNSPELVVANVTDAESDGLTYNFQLSTNENFSALIDSSYSISEGTDTTVWQVTNLLSDNLQYWWRAQVNDGYEYSEFSTPASFILNAEPEAPAIFALLSPENESTGLSNLPTFLWEMADDPDPMDYATYTIQIATDSSFSGIAFEINTGLDVSHEMTEVLTTDTEYWWRVIATDTDSLSTESIVYKFTVGYVAINDVVELPTEYVLQQNFPNPFNPSTTIRYGLPEDSNVSLIIYDIRGNVVQTLESSAKSAGWYELVWNGQTNDGRTISTGLYFARIVAGDYNQVIKMLYLK